jgi:signal peptidase I
MTTLGFDSKPELASTRIAPLRQSNPAPHRNLHRRPAPKHRKGRARRNRHPMVWVANVVMAVAIAMTGVVVVGSWVGHWRFETVLTGSMRPGIQPGDVEVLVPEPTSAIRVGQIVAFHPPHAAFTVTHRVIAVNDHHGVWITTKGDANDVRDPWGDIHIIGSSVWVVHHVIPHLGYVSMWVKSPLPHVLLLVVVVLLICVGTLRMIWRR